MQEEAMFPREVMRQLNMFIIIMAMIVVIVFNVAYGGVIIAFYLTNWFALNSMRDMDILDDIALEMELDGN